MPQSSMPVMPHTNDDSNWSSWARLVLANLERHEEQIDKIFNLLDTHRNELRQEIRLQDSESRKAIDSLRGDFLAAVLKQSETAAAAAQNQASAYQTELKQLQATVTTRFGAHDVTLAELKQELTIKSGLWGLLGGAIPTACALLFFILKLKLGGG